MLFVYRECPGTLNLKFTPKYLEIAKTDFKKISWLLKILQNLEYHLSGKDDTSIITVLTLVTKTTTAAALCKICLIQIIDTSFLQIVVRYILNTVLSVVVFDTFYELTL